MDINGDGHNDILSGSYATDSKEVEGMAGLFHVLWGSKKGGFSKAQILRGSDGKPLMIPAKEEDIAKKICTRPTAVDWNQDGHLDLVVGNFEGGFYVFNGEGKGKFAPKPSMIQTKGKPLVVPGMHSDPFVVDWDRDGDLDLISGSDDGGVYWSENKAKPKTKESVMGPFKVLVAPYKGKEEMLEEDQLNRSHRSSRVWVDDFNGDGKWDLLVGDTLDLQSRAEGLSEEAFKKKKAEWEADMEAITKAMDKAKNGSEDMRVLQKAWIKLVNKQAEFLTSTSTGYIWLYEQK